MGLTPRFTRADVRNAVEKRRMLFRKAVINRLELVGWEFVKMARDKTASSGGFNDVTGNLRSSIGFAVVDHGTVKKENYEVSKGGQKKAEGIQEAKNFIRTLKGNFDDGFALIVVAGMGYAAAVESRGKDVITGSSLEAESILKAAIDKLKEKMNR